MKFKVGDKVRVVCCEEKGQWYSNYIGDTFTIKENKDLEGDYMIKEYNGYINENDMELIKESKMIEMQEDDKIVEVEYETTINIGQFENLKPKLKMKCKANEVEQTLLFLRSRLSKEKKAIKGGTNV